MKLLFLAALMAEMFLAGSAGAFCDNAHYVNVSGHCVRRPVYASQAPQARRRSATMALGASASTIAGRALITAA